METNELHGSRNGRLSQEEAMLLVSAHKAGDTDAGWKLVLESKPMMIYRVGSIKGYLGVDLDELLQEYQIQLFQKLDDYEPTQPFHQFVFGIGDRAAYWCRRLANRPQESSRCREFAQDFEYELSAHSKGDCWYDEVIARSTEVDDAIENSTCIKREGVAVLRQLCLGKSHPEIADHLDEHYPQWFVGKRTQGGKAQWRKSLNSLIDETLANIRAMLGTVGGERSLSQKPLTEEIVRQILSVAFTPEHPSPQTISLALRRSGVLVRLEAIGALFNRFDVRRRRAEVEPDRIENEKQAILDEWRLQLGKPTVPPLSEVELLNDDTWMRIDELICATPIRKTHRHRWRRNTDSLLVAHRFNCADTALPEGLASADSVGKWRRTLKQLGILDQVLAIAGEQNAKIPEKIPLTNCQ